MEHHSSPSNGVLPPCRHLKVQLGDPTLVKHSLDEQSAMYLLDQGYIEDVTLSNIKIGLGVFSVALTILAQFYPKPFPQNADLLKACVFIYFLVQGVLQLVQIFVVKDCILVTKKRKVETTETSTGKRDKSKNNNKKSSSSSSSSSASSSSVDSLNLPSHALSLSTQFDRVDTPIYQIRISTRPSESLMSMVDSLNSSPTKDITSVTGAYPITEFFDVNGVFLIERFHARMKALLEQYAHEASKKKE